jgi:hypothetical protein
MKDPGILRIVTMEDARSPTDPIVMRRDLIVTIMVRRMLELAMAIIRTGPVILELHQNHISTTIQVCILFRVTSSLTRQ